MKKVFWGGMIGGVLFLMGSAQAVDTLICPNLDLKVLTPQECNTPKFLEVYAPKYLKQEMNRFNLILNDLHHDNASPPDKVVDKIMYDFREHKSCLEKICADSFDVCAQSSFGSTTTNQRSWCFGKVNQVLDLQRAKMDYIATGNQARKERSLMEEKLNAMGERFGQFIHERFINILNQAERLEAKINYLILSPKR